MDNNDSQGAGTGTQYGGKELFVCPGCGNTMYLDAVICPSCGRQVRDLSVQQSRSYYAPKDRTVAILLAIFLGLWTWLYTYDVDSNKFWINLIASVVTCGLFSIVSWIWAIIDVASRPEYFYANYPNG